MPREVLRIGVIGRSHPPATRWGGRVLRPFSVTDTPVPLLPGTLMHDADGLHTVWLGDHQLMLHHGETAHYRTNLSSARPSIWVAMDGEHVHLATPDPYEGEALASDPARVVEALAMPPAVQAQVADFIARHHVEEVFHKRRRTPASGQDGVDPRAPRILPPDQKWGRK